MADRAFQAERRRRLAEYSICRQRLKRLGQIFTLILIMVFLNPVGRRTDAHLPSRLRGRHRAAARPQLQFPHRGILRDRLRADPRRPGML